MRDQKSMDAKAYLLMCSSYKVLCKTQFKERETLEGQRLLAEMRDVIAEYTGQDSQEVQDWAES